MSPWSASCLAPMPRTGGVASDLAATGSGQRLGARLPGPGGPHGEHRAHEQLVTGQVQVLRVGRFVSLRAWHLRFSLLLDGGKIHLPPASSGWQARENEVCMRVSTKS